MVTPELNHWVQATPEYACRLHFNAFGPAPLRPGVGRALAHLFL
jgi:hypothetical protein